jgi:hypothetical protein
MITRRAALHGYATGHGRGTGSAGQRARPHARRLRSRRQTRLAEDERRGPQCEGRTPAGLHFTCGTSLTLALSLSVCVCARTSSCAYTYVCICACVGAHRFRPILIDVRQTGRSPGLSRRESRDNLRRSSSGGVGGKGAKGGKQPSAPAVAPLVPSKDRWVRPKSTGDKTTETLRKVQGYAFFFFFFGLVLLPPPPDTFRISRLFVYFISLLHPPPLFR